MYDNMRSQWKEKSSPTVIVNVEFPHLVRSAKESSLLRSCTSTFSHWHETWAYINLKWTPWSYWNLDQTKCYSSEDQNEFVIQLLGGIFGCHLQPQTMCSPAMAVPIDLNLQHKFRILSKAILDAVNSGLQDDISILLGVKFKNWWIQYSCPVC